VTGTEIRLFGAAQLDGPAKSMTEDVPLAWKAVLDKVNRAGGVCGRRISLVVMNGLFGASHDVGREEVVGMLAGPFDRALDARLSDGSVDHWGIPVVGSDGRGRPQFFSAWNWPVGPPVEGLVRIGAEEAYRGAGARTFALVYDSNFGEDVERAFSEYVGALPGATVKAVQALDPGDPGYAGDANEFNRHCRGTACDAVILALLPETLKKWWQADPERARSRSAVVGVPVSDRIGQDCGRLIGNACDELRVWTSFTPPIAPFLDEPDVREYAGDVRNPGNTATTTAYVGAKVMVTALRQAGPHLTRASLRTALDAMTFSSGLVSTLDWGPRLPLDRAGNSAARAVRMEVSDGTFRNWTDAGTGWVRDPWPGSFPN
jgi:ABC-type branched-subunit amino acid transport system substrate-binding protein